MMMGMCSGAAGAADKKDYKAYAAKLDKGL